MDKIFLKNVLKLSSGTSLAHIITIVISPVLTRLYSADDFGELQLFQSLLIVASLLTTGCYHYMIIQPELKDDALALMKGVWFISISSSLLLLVTGLMLKVFTPWLNSASLTLIILFPLTLVLNNLILICDYWFLRLKCYKTLSFSKITRSSSTASTQIGLFYSSLQPGLIVGLVLGRLFAVLYYLKSFGKNLIKTFGNIKTQKVFNQLKKYKAQPIQVLPSSILSSGSTELIVFLIAALFGDISLGFYALAYRVLSVPSAFLGTSVGEVFYQKANELIKKKMAVNTLLYKTWLGLASVSLIPSILLFLYGEKILSIIFGAEWITAGTVAELLAPLIFVNFISAPTGKLLMALGEQKVMPLLSLCMIISRVSGLMIGYFSSGFLMGILLMVVFHIASLFLYNIVLVFKVRKYQMQLTDT
ncbi:MAG: oligosaccharide flippase family protein [Balneolaceae bacterium]|nr:oligosaccharide flippase family protein [Balneolaceae bacterium]